MKERVQKIIAAAGISSRRAAEQLILDGRVKVNGAVVTELGTKADPEEDHVKVDGKLINPRQPKTYIMLNKPAGYVTTMSDPEGRPVITDLLQGVKVRVYPVGRLDYDTEGLLLLTNDGEFAHLVTHPRHELPKTYLVKVKGVLEDRDVENLERGVFLKDGKTAPARVRRLRKEEANSWVEIVIHEGRKRQVRRMIEHTGRSVIKLKRTRVGSLDLGDLPLGTYRHLAPDEVKGVQEAAQGAEDMVESRLMPGETVSVPSGPAGAKRQLTFIEGPKPKKRTRTAAAPRRTMEKYPAEGGATSRPSRRSESTDRRREGKATWPAPRGARPEGKRPWQSDKRYDKPSFGGRAERPEDRKPWPEKRSARKPFGGPDRSSQSRAGRTGEGFKTREGRSFGSRAASPGQRGPRPEGKRPWQGEKRFGKTAIGGGDHTSHSRPSRPDERFKSRGGSDRPFVRRAARPEKQGRRPEGKRPWQGERLYGEPASGGRDRTSHSRAPRTDDRFKSRENAGRPFGSRASWKKQAGQRPEGARPWQAAKRMPRPGSTDSRSRTGGQRASGPRTGWARSSNDRSKKGRGTRRRS